MQYAFTSKGPGVVKCTGCGTFLTLGTSYLKRHAESKKHIERVDSPFPQEMLPAETGNNPRHLSGLKRNTVGKNLNSSSRTVQDLESTELRHKRPANSSQPIAIRSRSTTPFPPAEPSVREWISPPLGTRPRYLASDVNDSKIISIDGRSMTEGPPQIPKDAHDETRTQPRAVRDTRSRMGMNLGNSTDLTDHDELAHIKKATGRLETQLFAKTEALHNLRGEIENLKSKNKELMKTMDVETKLRSQLMHYVVEQSKHHGQPTTASKHIVQLCKDVLEQGDKNGEHSRIQLFKDLFGSLCALEESKSTEPR